MKTYENQHFFTIFPWFSGQGLQSNHCRATAVAARMVNLESHLVLLATWPG
jgi:hypothetical protein